MMQEINAATKRELAMLEKKLKSDLELVDRTAHFRHVSQSMEIIILRNIV